MIILLLVLFGLCLGSFVNALVWRVHEQEKPKSKQPKVDLSIMKGRSVCPHCSHVLAARDLIPVVSWLSVGGKCRYCRKPISLQYPIVEILTALLFVISYYAWPVAMSGSQWALLSAWLVAVVLFVALSVYDIRWMELPDRLVAILTGVAVVIVLGTAFIAGEPSELLGALWGVLCIAGLFYVLFQVSGGKWIGGGDVKLGVPLGLLVGGPLKSILLIFVASLLGTLVVLPLLLTGNRKLSQKLPFGPFLIIAAFIVFLFGPAMIDWYQTQLLLL